MRFSALPIPSARPALSRPPSECNVRRGLGLALPSVADLFARCMRATHCLFDFSGYRWTQEQIDKLRIELSTAALRNNASRLAQASRMTIPTAMRNRVEAVRDRNDTR